MSSRARCGYWVAPSPFPRHHTRPLVRLFYTALQSCCPCCFALQRSFFEHVGEWLPDVCRGLCTVFHPQTACQRITCLIGFLEDISMCAHPCSHPLCLSSAGEVKARCGTSFYKNVLYPFVKMYDPEDSHNLSIWVCGAPVLTHLLHASPTSSTFNPFHIQVVVQHHPRIATPVQRLLDRGARPRFPMQFLVLDSTRFRQQAASSGLVPYDNCADHEILKSKGAVFTPRSLARSCSLLLAPFLARMHTCSYKRDILPQTRISLHIHTHKHTRMQHTCSRAAYLSRFNFTTTQTCQYAC